MPNDCAGTQPGAPSMPTTALEGVKVLDISNLRAAPMSTMYLADF